MIRKIIISVINIILWSGIFCPLQAQQNSAVNKEIMQRTNYQQGIYKEFIMPDEVFARGRELLFKMKEEHPSAAPRQIDYRNKQMIPYISSDLIGQEVNLPVSNYYDIIKSALSEDNDSDFRYYMNFYRQIVWNKDGTPDLNKASTAKAYFAFYNLIYNDGKPSHLQVGRIDEHFPLLAVYADSFFELQKRFGNDDAYLWFTFALYNNDGVDHMIPIEDAEKADIISKEILYNDLKKYGITQKQADEWLKFATSWSSDFSNSPAIKDVDGRIVSFTGEGNWYLTIFLRSQKQLNIRNEARGGYLPLALVASHEFQHIKDTFPGETEVPSLAELTTTVKQIIETDDIYRKIHKISDMEPVKYRKQTDITQIEVGEVAVFFRNLSKTYNTDDYAKLMLTKESTDFIKSKLSALGSLANLANSKSSNPSLLSPQQLREYGKQCLHEILTEQFM